jgi:hypothetical protein
MSIKEIVTRLGKPIRNKSCDLVAANQKSWQPKEGLPKTLRVFLRKGKTKKLGLGKA